MEKFFENTQVTGLRLTDADVQTTRRHKARSYIPILRGILRDVGAVELLAALATAARQNGRDDVHDASVDSHKDAGRIFRFSRKLIRWHEWDNETQEEREQRIAEREAQIAEAEQEVRKNEVFIQHIENQGMSVVEFLEAHFEKLRKARQAA